jgi:hypothetical protein
MALIAKTAATPFGPQGANGVQWPFLLDVGQPVGRGVGSGRGTRGCGLGPLPRHGRDVVAVSGVPGTALDETPVCRKAVRTPGVTARPSSG